MGPGSRVAAERVVTATEPPLGGQDAQVAAGARILKMRAQDARGVGGAHLGAREREIPLFSSTKPRCSPPTPTCASWSRFHPPGGGRLHQDARPSTPVHLGRASCPRPPSSRPPAGPRRGGPTAPLAGLARGSRHTGGPSTSSRRNPRFARETTVFSRFRSSPRPCPAKKHVFPGRNARRGWGRPQNRHSTQDPMCPLREFAVPPPSRPKK